MITEHLRVRFPGRLWDGPFHHPPHPDGRLAGRPCRLRLPGRFRVASLRPGGRSDAPGWFPSWAAVLRLAYFAPRPSMPCGFRVDLLFGPHLSRLPSLSGHERSWRPSRDLVDVGRRVSDRAPVTAYSSSRRGSSSASRSHRRFLVPSSCLALCSAGLPAPLLARPSVGGDGLRRRSHRPGSAPAGMSLAF